MSQAPYPGLRAFARDEVDIFFGRQAHVLQLLQCLQQFPFLAVVGPSGYGKSSLVRTGLLAALETGFLPQAGVQWQVAVMRPGHQPFVQLAHALLADAELGAAYLARADFSDATAAVELLAATLQRSPASLLNLLDSLPLPSGSNLLLVVDQFEEIFRYYQQGAAEVAAAFVRLLLHSAVLREAGVSVYVVLTMRSDFLGDCAVFEGLPEVINQGLFLTPRLTREQLQLAIERPAQVFGGAVAPALVNQLLNDVGDNPDQLPVLQHALLRMWDLAADGQLTLAHYQQIGGLQAALSNHADEVLFNLTATQQHIAELLFKNLTERGSGERDTRRPVLLSAVVALVDAPAAEVMTVVEAFRAKGCHFLTPPLDKPLQLEAVLDISHESLIRQWRRLQQWVEEEADNAELYQRLEDAALRHQTGQMGLWRTPELEIGLRWRDTFQPSQAWVQRYGAEAGSHFALAMQFLADSAAAQLTEQRERRRRMQLLSGLLVFSLFTTGLAVWQWQAALHATETAQQQEQAALRTQSLFLADLAQQQLRKDLPYTAAKLALAALPTQQPPERPFTQEARQALFDSFQQPGVLEHPAAVSGAVFSPDGKQLLTRAGNTAWLWDVQTGEPLFMLQGHEYDVNSAAFSADGRRIVTASGDNTARLWDADSGAALATLQGHEDNVNSAAFSTDGRRIVTASDDHTARLWDADSGAALATLRHQGGVTSAAFSTDGKRIVTASSGGTARLWDTDNGAALATLRHQGVVTSAAFSADGRRIVTASWDNTARLWDADSGAVLATLQGHEDYVYSAAFSTDGRHIVTASRDNTARLWDADSGAALATLQGHEDDVNSAVFSTDDRRIITASGDNTAWLWDANSGAVLAILRGHKSSVNSAAFSADGRRIVTASWDNTARLWDAASGAALAILRGHEGGVYSAAFNTDGTRIVTASDDDTARLWRIFPDLNSMIQAAEQRTRFHPLSCAQQQQFFLLPKDADCEEP